MRRDWAAQRQIRRPMAIRRRTGHRTGQGVADALLATAVLLAVVLAGYAVEVVLA